MKRWMGLLTLACVLSLAMPTDALAQVHGVFRVVKGQVQVKSGKNGKIKRAKIGQKVFPKDTIITGKDSRAKVVMVDKNVINISPESNLEIENYEFEPKKGKKNVLLNVIYGKVRSKVNQKYDGKKAKFQVKTKSAVAGVRGTDFLAGFDRQTQKSQVVTFEGEVSFGQPGPGGSIKNPVSVGVGQMADVAGNGPPAPPRSVPPKMLAQMDNESNADSAPGPGSDKREPANNEKEGGDDKKKKEGGDDKADGKKGGDKKDGADKGNKGKSDQAKGGDKGRSQQAKDGNKTTRDTDKSNNGKRGGPNGGSAGAAPGTPGSGGDSEGGDQAGNEPPPPGSEDGGDQAGNEPPPPGGDDGSQPPPPGDDGTRDPASIGGTDGGDPIAGGDPSMSDGMMPPPPPPSDIDMDIPELPGGIDDISGIPDIPEVPECDTCRDIIESGTARILIQIQNGN